MISRTFPVPPDAVRVWRGFRLPSLTTEKFNEYLGATFIPAAVRIQEAIGLKSYIPTIVDGLPNKPQSVPDETAVLFWGSQQTYKDSFSKAAMRVYTLVHAGVFDNSTSRSGFPVSFGGSLDFDQPVYLIEKRADWMGGSVRHLVAERPASTDPQTFRASISKALAAIKKDVPLEGAIACVGRDYITYWELVPAERGGDAPSGVPLLSDSLTGWSHAFVSEPKHVQRGLWDDWAGLHVDAGSCLNMQFDRQ